MSESPEKRPEAAQTEAAPPQEPVSTAVSQQTAQPVGEDKNEAAPAPIDQSPHGSESQKEQANIQALKEEEAPLKDAPIKKTKQPEEAEDKVNNSPEEAPAPTPKKQLNPGSLDSLFNGLSKIGPLALLFFLACMAWPIFWEPAKGVFCPAEIKSLTAFLHCIATGSWLAPTALDNGAWSLAQWPVFSWCIGLFTLVPGLVESGYLLPVVSFSCTFFAVLGVWCLAEAAGFGLRASFAAALILLCAPLFAPLPHFMGPATLAAGLLLFSIAFFCRGWMAQSSWLCLPLGFICTAFAGLAGGLLHFATPLLASFCFLVWRGSFHRAQRADALFGFVLMLAILGIWLGYLILGDGNGPYLDQLFNGAWQFAWPLPLKWLLPLAAGLLGLLPWLLMIFGVSWLRVLSRAASTLGASRHANGSALIWISLVIAICIAIFTPWFHPAAVAIACLAAILLGKAAVHLSPIGNRFFYLLASLCLIIVGAVILCVSFASTQGLLFEHLPALPVPDLGQRLLSLSTLPIMGGIVLVGGIIGLFFVKTWQGSGGLLYGMLLVIILCQPARLMLVPELAAMPGTPLTPYSAIEQQVQNAMQQTSAVATPAEAPEPATEAQPEATASEPGQPTNEAAPVEAPQAPEETQPEATAPEQTPGEQTPEAATAPGEAAPEAQTPVETASEAAEQAPAPIETPPVAAETAPGAPAPAAPAE